MFSVVMLAASVLPSTGVIDTSLFFACAVLGSVPGKRVLPTYTGLQYAVALHLVETCWICMLACAYGCNRTPTTGDRAGEHSKWNAWKRNSRP